MKQSPDEGDLGRRFGHLAGTSGAVWSTDGRNWRLARAKPAGWVGSVLRQSTIASRVDQPKGIHACGIARLVDSGVSRSSIPRKDGRGIVDMEVTQVGNKIVHAEVVGKDGPALQKFWGDLFGWQQNTDFPGGYAMTDANDSGIVLGTGPAPDGGSGWVTFYVTVDDLDATLDRAESLGGKVVAPKFSPAPDTWLAMVADAEGHVVGLSQGS